MKFVLDTIEFNSNVADADGALWYVSEVQGWDAPALRQTNVDPTSRHGQVIAQNLLNSRALTLTGVCKTSGGEAGFWKAWNRLQGVTSKLATPMSLTGSEDVDKRLSVFRSDALRCVILPGNFTFEIQLTAPDPLKYAVSGTAVTLNPGETKTLTNNGNFDSSKITVTTSALAATRLTHVSTSRYVASDPVPAGTVFDYYTKTALAGTINQYGQIASSSVWWTLVPGTNQITNSGGTAVTINYYSAWV